MAETQPNLNSMDRGRKKEDGRWSGGRRVLPSMIVSGLAVFEHRPVGPALKGFSVAIVAWFFIGIGWLVGIVHDDSYPSAVVHHLDAIDLPALVFHGFGAQNLSTALAFDPTYRIGEVVLVIVLRVASI